MNLINNQEKTKRGAHLVASLERILNGFLKTVLQEKRELSFKRNYINYEKFCSNTIDISSIVFGENDRLIFQPAEQAFMKAVFTAGKRTMSPRVVLLVGTEYGLVVMHGERDTYGTHKGKVHGDLPTLHTTLALRSAIMRHKLRTGLVGKGHVPYASDMDVMDWMFSENFRTEILAQVEDDKLNGIAVGDGMKLFERETVVKAEKKPAKKWHQKKAPAAAQAVAA